MEVEMTVSKTYGAAVKKYLLIPVAVLAVGVVLLAAEAGKMIRQRCSPQKRRQLRQ